MHIYQIEGSEKDDEDYQWQQARHEIKCIGTGINYTPYDEHRTYKFSRN